MRAKICNLFSPDLLDLEHDVPGNPEHFGIEVMIDVGAEDEPGTDTFSVRVCTPSWLAAFRLQEKPYVWGAYYLLLSRYDYPTLLQAITSICDTAQGDTWEDVARQIGRYMYWEYEEVASS